MFDALRHRYEAFSERVLASLSEIEREDVKSFDRWFYSGDGWRWLVGIIAATTFFAWVASQDVAEAGVRGMERGKGVVVPGAVNRVSALGGQFTPRGGIP